MLNNSRQTSLEDSTPIISDLPLQWAPSVVWMYSRVYSGCILGHRVADLFKPVTSIQSEGPIFSAQGINQPTSLSAVSLPLPLALCSQAKC